MRILFAYDGSQDADGAIVEARNTFGGHGLEAVVLTVWEERIADVLRALRLDTPHNPHTHDRARRLAEHGARVAGDLGFDARPLWVVDQRPIGEEIVAGAEELDPDLIVLGAHGLGDAAGNLGSVSDYVRHHARQPVFVGRSGSRRQSAAPNAQAIATPNPRPGPSEHDRQHAEPERAAATGGQS